MKFTKMQGIGNDFVMVNALESVRDDLHLGPLSRKICDRRFGIGADGLILVLPSRVANFRMRVFNPDGSEAEMCGNGIRCFAKYVYDRKLIPETNVKVETLAGVLPLKLNLKAGRVDTVKVEMGVPKLLRNEIPMRGEENSRVVNESIKLDGRKFEITAVSMGNPHIIIFEDSLTSFPVSRYGPLLETHKSFPQRTNVHFVMVQNNSEMTIRTWERGAGETLACGTGACASTVASVLNGKTGRNVLVHLPGGDLRVEWMGDNRVVMTGPAEEVYEGEIDI